MPRCICRADRLDIWMGSQSALDNAKMAAEEAGLKPEQVYFHQMYLGGGFGRRTFGDELRHAIRVAKAGNINVPLQLLWSREQDMHADRYRPQSAIRMKGALTPDGKLEAIYIQSVCGSIARSTGRKVPDGIDGTALEGIGPSVPYNKIPNWYTGQMLKNTHVPVAYWRSVGGSQNCFYLESFIDELAHAAGKDPLEFRRSLTDRADSLAVLNKLEEISDWHKPLPAGTRARHFAGREPRRGGRPGRGSDGGGQWRGQGGPGLRRHRRLSCGQSQSGGCPDRRRRDLRHDRDALWRDHHQGRRRGAGQFQRLPHGADARCARRW